ncbi:hypothetical protein [Sulfurospirillum barnesii]|uniref:Uncharacterized protein n=1 Tax=Sulfurospirillum barnesii (strain ATCC 700032 / DSM 10660 / SES-3) TaxID=760154 RepID=I3XUQ3_SULBS|nr:hypothetical protein [Sulfurospirillum barnesii]AFL67677.1 hypothetical protein Sulba_0353 [Sulfurospirillum barnesii SES-3]
MDSRLFQIDPYAGIGYGMYNSIKGEEGSFEDFLLHYDSTKANEGDNSWLSNLIAKETLNAFSSPDVWQAMNTLGISGLDFMGSSNFFDAQVYALKIQLFEAFSKRDDYKEMEPLLKQLLS